MSENQVNWEFVDAMRAEWNRREICSPFPLKAYMEASRLIPDERGDYIEEALKTVWDKLASRKYYSATALLLFRKSEEGYVKSKSHHNVV
jgi:hypothetical protein